MDHRAVHATSQILNQGLGQLHISVAALETIQPIAYRALEGMARRPILLCSYLNAPISARPLCHK